MSCKIVWKERHCPQTISLFLISIYSPSANKLNLPISCTDASKFDLDYFQLTRWTRSGFCSIYIECIHFYFDRENRMFLLLRPSMTAVGCRYLKLEGVVAPTSDLFLGFTVINYSRHSCWLKKIKSPGSYAFTDWQWFEITAHTLHNMLH